MIVQNPRWNPTLNFIYFYDDLLEAKDHITERGLQIGEFYCLHNEVDILNLSTFRENTHRYLFISNKLMMNDNVLSDLAIQGYCFPNPLLHEVLRDQVRSSIGGKLSDDLIEHLTEQFPVTPNGTNDYSNRHVIHSSYDKKLEGGAPGSIFLSLTNKSNRSNNPNHVVVKHFEVVVDYRGPAYSLNKLQTRRLKP